MDPGQRRRAAPRRGALVRVGVDLDRPGPVNGQRRRQTQLDIALLEGHQDRLLPGDRRPVRCHLDHAGYAAGALDSQQHAGGLGVGHPVGLAQQVAHQVDLVNVVVDERGVLPGHLGVHSRRGAFALQGWNLLAGFDSLQKAAGDPVARRHEDANVFQRPHLARGFPLLDPGPGARRRRIAALVVTDHVGAPGLGGCGNQLLARFDRQGQRLLGKEIFHGRIELRQQGGVVLEHLAGDDAVEFLRFEHLPVVTINIRHGVLGRNPLGRLRAQLGQGHDLAALDGRVVLQVGHLTHSADANEADPNFLHPSLP